MSVDQPASSSRASPIESGTEAARADLLPPLVPDLATRLVPACLATCMSGLVSAVVTAINTGFEGGYLGRWLGAWALALPAAVTGAYLFRSVAIRMARALAALGALLSRARLDASD